MKEHGRVWPRASQTLYELNQQDAPPHDGVRRRAKNGVPGAGKRRAGRIKPRQAEAWAE